MLRGAKSWRGRLMLGFIIVLGLVILVPSILAGFLLRNQREANPVSSMAEPYFPLLLMGLCVMLAFTSAGERAIYFSPAEVNFLFAGPFSRRELIAYKLSRNVLGVVVLAFFMATTQWILFPSWLGAFVGIALSLFFLQLTAMATAMVSQIVAESAYTKSRQWLLALFLGAVAVGMSQALAGSGKGNLTQMVSLFAGTAPGKVVLAPFQVFARAAFARDIYPDLVMWAGAAFAIDFGILLLILKLDADYLELAATVSQKMYSQIRRLQEGGGFSTSVGSHAGRFRVPVPPWCGGVGPVAWRQLLLAVRTSRQMMIMSLAFCSIMLLGMLFSRTNVITERMPMTAGISVVAYLTFLFSMQAPWAFRGDIDRIDWLKMLPARPIAIAAGELVGGLCILTSIQLIVFFLTAVIVPDSIPIAIVASLFCLPLNIVLLSSSNLLFLLYPVRSAMGASFDVHTFGRIMLSLIFQVVLLLPALGLPSLFGAVAYVAFDWSATAFAITTWFSLVAELPVLLLGVAWAFERFDPSLHTPPED
jgi:hypothetical protein